MLAAFFLGIVTLAYGDSLVSASSLDPSQTVLLQVVVTGDGEVTATSNYRASDDFPPPAPPPGPDDALSTFDGGSPNGAWNLYLVDDAGFDMGSITSWSLTITTSGGPPPPPGVSCTGPGITITSAGQGDPYPSDCVVSGLTGTITDVNMTLTGLSHTYPDDIDILLVPPGASANATVMSDAGGSSDVNAINLTLDDEAATQLPDAGQLATGSYRPANSGSNLCDRRKTMNPGVCYFDYESGTDVALTATSHTSEQSFVGWSITDCPGTGTCHIRLDEELTTAVARFSPVTLRLQKQGPGAVEFTPGDDCPIPVTSCANSYEAGTHVVLTARPEGSGGLRWLEGSWCEPDNNDYTNPTCRTTVDFSGATVSIGFEPQEPWPISFGVSANVRVSIGGTGTGRVRGVGLDCPGDCSSDSFHYGRTVRLTADAGANSVFAGWGGVCGNASTCQFSAGSITWVRAVFNGAPPPPPPPPPSSPPPPSPASFTARLIGVKVVRRKGARTVVVRLAVNARARGLIDLRRRGRALAHAAHNLQRGTQTLRLRLPKKVTRGWSVLRLRVQSRAPQGTARIFTRRLWLPPAHG